MKDCIFVNSGDPWKPRPDVAERVKKMLEEIHRVLTPTGMFISIAFGQVTFQVLYASLDTAIRILALKACTMKTKPR